MKKLLLALSVGMIALSSHAADMDKEQDMDKMAKEVSACAAHPKYSSWEESKITADVHQALNIFMQNVQASSKLKRVSEVRTLNQDGRYIALEVQLDDGEYWNGVIHHNPRNDYLVSSIPHVGKLCE